MVLDLDSANAAVNAVCKLCDGGYLDIYAGQVRLVRVLLGEPAFEAAQDGMAEAHAIKPAAAVESGTATRFEVVRASGKVVFTGHVSGPMGDTVSKVGDLRLSDVAIRRFAVVTIESLTYTQERYS